MGRKKLILHDLDCGPWDRSGTPWGQEADSYCQGSGEPFEHCRDLVIFLYLQYGDVRPLVDLLRTGVSPGPGVLRLVAAMFGAPSAEQHDDLPFRFEITGNKGNRTRERDIVWRDRLLSDQVDKVIGGNPGTYDAAIRAIADDLGLGFETVRKAYDKRHRKTTGGPS